MPKSISAIFFMRCSSDCPTDDKNACCYWPAIWQGHIVLLFKWILFKQLQGMAISQPVIFFLNNLSIQIKKALYLLTIKLIFLYI